MGSPSADAPDAVLHAVLPRPTTASQPFWDGCGRGELLLPHCTACGHIFYFPRLHCPKCGDREPGWLKSAGRGRIFSFTHVTVSFHGPRWDSQLPYTVVLVDLDEGPRMLSRLIGDDRHKAASGDAVEVVFPEVEGQRLPFFRRSPGSSMSQL